MIEENKRPTLNLVPLSDLYGGESGTRRRGRVNQNHVAITFPRKGGEVKGHQARIRIGAAVLKRLGWVRGTPVTIMVHDGWVLLAKHPGGNALASRTEDDSWLEYREGLPPEAIERMTEPSGETDDPESKKYWKSIRPFEPEVWEGALVLVRVREIVEPADDDDFDDSVESEELDDVGPEYGPAEGIEALVCDDIAARQRLGINKYGTTVANSPLELKQWVQHLYEELLDAAVYARRTLALLDANYLPMAEIPDLDMDAAELRAVDNSERDE